MFFVLLSVTEIIVQFFYLAAELLTLLLFSFCFVVTLGKKWINWEIPSAVSYS
jgi:hypothetical protein